MKKTTALEKAILYLKHNLETGIWKKGDRLPTYRQLAHIAGVGQVSMWKALSQLRFEKKLAFKERTGIFVGDSLPVNEEVLKQSSQTPFWQTLVDLIKKDILFGQLHDYTHLPSSKELMALYDCGYYSLNKALVSLSSQSIIAPAKRWYRIVRSKSKTPSNSICLVMSKEVSNFELAPVEESAFESFMESLESACSHKNIRIIKHSVDIKMETYDSLYQHFAQVQGFIVWHCAHIGHQILDLVKDLVRFGKPMAIIKIAHSGEADPYLQLQKKSEKNKEFFFTNAAHHRKAGRAMGRFLLEKGHTRVCFFTAFNEYDNKEKFLGTVEAFESAGIHNGVELLVCNSISEEDRAQFSLAQDNAMKTALAQVNKFLDSFVVSSQEKLSDSHIWRLNNRIYEYKFSRNYLFEYILLFRKACAMKDVTAWICAEDALATYGAQNFLKSIKSEKNITIDVVSFNDQIEAKINNLTSYRYDYAGTARKALNLIMFPKYSRKSICFKGTNAFEIDGMVVDRG